MVLLVCICWFHNMAPLPSKLAATIAIFTHTSFRCLLYLYFLHMLRCFWAHVSFMYRSFASIVHTDMTCSVVTSNCSHNPHLLSVFVCNIFVAKYFVCNAWSSVAIISLSVSPFKSSLESQRNGSSSIVSCLSMLAVVCWMSTVCVSLFSFDLFNSSATFAVVLIAELTECYCIYIHAPIAKIQGNTNKYTTSLYKVFSNKVL
jgi:hypothetical protein